MKPGDLVMNIFTRELGLVTSFDSNGSDYVNVICCRQEWLIPIEHLEVVSESV